eukprot:Em0208g5a
MLQDDEEDELSYVRTKLCQKSFQALSQRARPYLVCSEMVTSPKVPPGLKRRRKIDVSPKDKAAETVAHFVLDRSKEIIERLTAAELQVLESCRSWLRERDDKASAIFVTAGTVARELQLQEGIPQEVRKARIDMLAGNVGKVLKEHNLEACIFGKVGKFHPIRFECRSSLR